ncbi:MAG: ATP-binding protein [Bacteroidaceae bacterium]|nr:ATP-binding protein [Bacteroidaceae bacterium]
MKNLPFDIKKTGQIVVFIGIQASGKTTFFREWLAPHGYVHINLDTLNTRPRESQSIWECYLHGLSFVVDNTNPEKTDRERYIPEAKAHGYEVIGIFFQSSLKECITRNDNRERKVPVKAIPCTQNKLQLPEYAEGFDKLFFVRIKDNEFEITDWRE